MPEFLFTPVPHDEAIEFIRSKPVVSRAVFDQLLPELQARAFTITGLVPADVMQTVRDMIADVPAGMPWDTQKALIARSLSPYFDEADAIAKAELLLRVHGQEAYASAADAVMRRQLAVFPYWQYQTMMDTKVRSSHRVLHGLILPADSPFWITHDPPWEWGCRCIKIPMSDDDVEEIRFQNAKQIYDRGFLLPNNLRRELETTNRLVIGANVYNVAPTGTFKFDPQSLTLTVDQLRARYSPEVWGNFESWARKTSVTLDPIKDSRTVWNWINGEPGAPEVFRVPTTGPPAPPPTARNRPVSDAFIVRIRDRAFRSDMAEALTAIDRTHDDGVIPPLTLRPGRSIRALGELKVDKSVVEVREKGPWRRLTLAHEAGHVLDYYGIGERLKFASDTEPALQAWRDAIDSSAATQKIKTEPGVPNRRYLSSRREQFARSYAQYIAFKSQNPALLADVDRVLQNPAPWRHWEWDDFAPIAKAFDDLFRQLGWMQ